MKQVDFYLISNRVVDAKYKLASRLANKLLKLDQRALVITDDTESTDHLDRVMWSFSDTSFLVHDRIDIKSSPAAATETKPETKAVRIGEHAEIDPSSVDSKYDVLVNLSKGIPLISHHFSRIAEIVEQDDDSKANARQRYKDYQAEGFEIKTHPIEL